MKRGRNSNECIEEGSHCLTDKVCYLGKLDYKISHLVTRTQVKIKKKYFGLTQNSFKSRYSGHKTSFKCLKYKTQTRLSRAIWRLKESNPPIPFKLKFSILKLARAYTRESKNCHLCAVEKTFIAFSDPSSTLNLRSELVNKCRHRRKHLHRILLELTVIFILFILMRNIRTVRMMLQKELLVLEYYKSQWAHKILSTITRQKPYAFLNLKSPPSLAAEEAAMFYFTPW